jgi:hypothetical protein
VDDLFDFVKAYHSRQPLEGVESPAEFIDDMGIDPIAVDEALHHQQMTAYRTKVLLGLGEIVIEEF